MTESKLVSGMPASLSPTLSRKRAREQTNRCASLTLIALLASLTFCLPASAKMYKWVDDKGTTHYGETIPPEYANKSNVEIDKGRTVKKTDILTPEQRRAKETADAQKRAEDEASLDQKRRDKALINTYSNEKEIDLKRGRDLQQLNARVDSISSQLKKAGESLLGLQKEAEARTAAGRKVPASLNEDIQESQARLSKLQQDLEKSKAEKTAAEARYDADKARYKELTGK